MKQGADDFIVEPTPVIDLRKHGLPLDTDVANDASQNWDNEKTEVYMDSDEDEAAASLIDVDGESHPITAFPFVLGRGGECDLVLSGKGLSRKHVEIVFQSGRFVINDLDSLNGLKVNGYKVSRVILEEGDQIKLGEVNLDFSSGGEIQGEGGNDNELSADSKDPFSSGTNKKKIIIAAFGSISFAVLLFGGYTAYKSSVSSQSGQIITKSPSVSAEAPRPSGVSALAMPTNPAVAPPVSISAPPPSLTLTKPVVQSAPGIVKPKPVKPKVTPPVVSKNLSKAKNLLSDANARYLDGDAPALFEEFKRYEQDSRLPKQLRTKMRNKHETLAKLYGAYIKGHKAFVAGNKAGAFSAWTKFLDNESRIYKTKRSLYADQVVPKIVDEYVRKGNASSQSGAHHKAYRMWQLAVKYGDSVAAKIALDSANTKSKQIYRKALSGG